MSVARPLSFLPIFHISNFDIVESFFFKISDELSLQIYQTAATAKLLAEAIVKRREDEGPFKSRKEILKVAGVGPKAFEQAAGFLRIRDAANP